jgi:hypothetical protein
MWKFIIIIMFCIFVALQVIGTGHRLAETFEDVTRDQQLVNYASIIAKNIISKTTPPIPSTAYTLCINWNSQMHNTTTTSASTKVLLRMYGVYTSPLTDRSKATLPPAYTDTPIKNILLPVNLIFEITPTKTMYSSLTAHNKTGTDWFERPDVTLVSFTLEIISGSPAYIESIAFIQQQKVDDAVLFTTVDSYTALCEPMALCLPKDLPTYAVDGMHLHSSTTGDMDDKVTLCRIPHTSGIHAWLTRESDPHSILSTYEHSTSADSHTVFRNTTGISRAYNVTIVLFQVPTTASGESVIQIRTKLTSPYSRYTSGSSPTSYPPDINRQFTPLLNIDTQNGHTFPESVAYVKISTRGATDYAVINVPIMLQGLGESIAYPGTLNVDDHSRNALLNACKVSWDKELSSSSPAKLDIASLQLSVLNHFSKGEPLIVGSFIGKSIGDAPAIADHRVYLSILKDNNQGLPPFSVAPMKAHGRIFTMYDKSGVDDTPSKKPQIKKFTGTAGSPITIGDGILLRGAANLTASSFSVTPTIANPRLRFSISFLTDHSNEHLIVFEIHRSYVTLKIGNLYAYKKPYNANQTTGDPNTNQKLNEHASDLSWVLQINKRGQIFFVVNKNDAAYGCRSLDGIHVPVLEQFYKQTLDLQGNHTYPAAHTITFDMSALPNAIVHTQIITDYDAPINRLTCDALTNDWNPYELSLLPTRILKLMSYENTAAMPQNKLTLPPNTNELTCTVYLNDDKTISNSHTYFRTWRTSVTEEVVSVKHLPSSTGMYLIVGGGSQKIPLTTVQGILTFQMVVDEIKRKGVGIVYCYYNGKHQVTMFSMQNHRFLGSAFYNERKPFSAPLKYIQTPGTVFSKAFVSLDVNPNIKGGVSKLFQKAQRDGSGGVSILLPHPAQGIRNINLSLNEDGKIRKLLFQNNESFKKGVCTGGQPLVFSKHNCSATAVPYGRTYYRIKDFAKTPNECALTTTCNGIANTDNTESSMQTENVYRAPEHDRVDILKFLITGFL